jgi:hypothetical protein
MRFTRFATLVSVALAAALVVQAQEKKEEKKEPAKPAAPMGAPKPGPEVKRLALFVGTWNAEGEMKPNSFGMPSGKFTSTDKCEWFTGGFQVVCHGSGKGPMGAVHSIGIISYNAEDKNYRYYGIDSMGMADQSQGNVDGNTWAFTNEGKMGGKSYHGRYTMTMEGTDSYTYKYETSDDGQKWTVMMDGKSTKAGGGEKKAPSKM